MRRPPTQCVGRSCAGGSMESPARSHSLGTNSGSRDSLNCRIRCGCRATARDTFVHEPLLPATGRFCAARSRWCPAPGRQLVPEGDSEAARSRVQALVRAEHGERICRSGADATAMDAISPEEFGRRSRRLFCKSINYERIVSSLTSCGLASTAFRVGVFKKACAFSTLSNANMTKRSGGFPSNLRR